MTSSSTTNSKSTLRAKQRSKNASPYGFIQPTSKPFAGTFYKPPEVKSTRHATKPKRDVIAALTIR